MRLPVRKYDLKACLTLGMIFLWTLGFTQSQTTSELHKGMQKLEELSLEDFLKAKAFAKNLRSQAKQAKNDSMLQLIWLKSSEIHRFLHDYDASRAFMDSVRSSKGFRNNPSLQLQAAKELGRIYYFKGKADSSILYYQQALDLSYQLKDSTEIANNLYNIGNTFVLVKSYQKGLEYLLQVLPYDMAREDYFGQGYTYSRIAQIYLDLENHEKAYEYAHRSLYLRKKLKHRQGIANTSSSLADYHQAKLHKDSTFYYRGQAIKISREMNDLKNLATYIGNLANSHYFFEDYKAALQAYEQSLAMFDTLADPYSNAHTLRNLSFTYRKIDRQDSAMKVLLRAKSLLQQNKESGRSLLSEVYFDLYQILRDIDQPISALEYLEMHLTLQDSLQEESSSNRIQELEQNLDLQEAGYKLDLLEKEKAIQQENLRKQERLNVLFIVFLLILFSLVLMLMNQVRQKAKALTKMRKAQRDLEKQKTELEHLNHTKNVFFSIIAHDLRSPLHSIGGLTQLLEKGDQLNPKERQEAFAYLSESVDRLKHLLNNLLQWAMAQTQGGEQWKPKAITFKDSILDTVKHLEGAAREKGIQLHTSKVGSEKILADPDEFSTIIRNLLSNAIKFTHPGGSIHITSAITQKKSVSISIKDEGIGMNEEERQHIFELDKKFVKPGTSKETGSGLGLALCFELLKKNKGKIDIKSQVGKGSIFTISLPQA